MKRFLLAMLLLGAALASLLPHEAAAADEICFSDTNPAIKNCISGAFKTFWERNGGLEVFGFPLSKVSVDKRPEGDVQVQWFERAKLERNKNLAEPYTIQGALIGDALLRSKGRNWKDEPAEQAKGGCIFFKESGHNLCEPFLSYFKTHGLRYGKSKDSTITQAESLGLFGLPLTTAASERAADGKEYLTQWFERARLELHPELPKGQQVLMGLIGSEAYALQPAKPQATPAPSDATPTPSTPTPAPSAEQPAAPACGPIDAATNAFVTETCLGPANRFRSVFSLSGYNPNERLGIWLLDADNINIGKLVGRDPVQRCSMVNLTVDISDLTRCSSFAVNDYGNASGVVLDAAALYPGRWTLMIQSIGHSDRMSMIPFEVLPRPLGKDDPCATVTASTNASMQPSCGYAGGVVKMNSSGYSAGENVGYYITGPDKIVEPVVAFYMPRKADSAGNDVLVALLPGNALRGEYTISGLGLQSGHAASGIVRVRYP